MKPLRYADAGVSFDAWEKTFRRIRRMVDSTRTAGALSKLGTFGGLFQVSVAYRRPVLVASADGVGTKLKVAFMARRHDTVGEDLVNHCVNDILVQGAKAMFFMDYFACGTLEPHVAEEVLKGFVRGCRREHVTLLGGETAEMPGFYAAGEYDLSGFIVGVVEKSKLLTGWKVKKGDILYGLPSTGLHTNGYSLARKIFFERAGWRISRYVPELRCTVGEALLKVHRCYEKPLRPLLEKNQVSALAHITGGGFTDNIPRILPPNCDALVDAAAWMPPAIFTLMQGIGRVGWDEMYRTFNMGIGMVAVVPSGRATMVEKHWRAANEKFYRIGKIVPGCGKVQYMGLRAKAC
jgi:phosphoribosylformylglycinamidine cyclo-ligase